jgi:O-antigen ligase
MTVESLRGAGRPAGRQRRFVTLTRSAAYLRAVDVMLVLTAAALPWSTSATAILVLLWLALLIPTIEAAPFVRCLAHPACILPLALFALAVLGLLWSEAPWADRLHGLNPVSKLLLVPFLLYRFRHSQRGHWVFISFVASCALLMALSWIVLFDPALKVTRTLSDGVPVKNYIDQSQEFALCAFALALPALTALRQRRWFMLLALFALIGAFIVNLLFVASARTALIYMPVLLIVFAMRYLSRRAMVALFAGTVVVAAFAWTSSPYLHKRVTDIFIEYQSYETNTLASTAQRLTYWRKSLKFIASAPLLGHGTGSIRGLFEQDAIGETGLRADVVSNPHNQTLNAGIQWGLFGVIILYALWFSHLRLLSEPGLAGWIGLAVVVQNVISSLLNSHLFDFTEGWIYVLGVGVAGGLALQANCRHESTKSLPVSGSPHDRLRR